MPQDIGRTKIGNTDQPGFLAGTSYFNSGPPKGVFYRTNGTFFNFSSDLGLFYLTASANYGFNVGFAGPGWSHRSVVTGRWWSQSEGAKMGLNMDLAQTESSAGILAGCTLNLDVMILLEAFDGYEWVSDGWNSYPVRIWSVVLNVPKVSFTIDILALLEKVIRLIVQLSTGRPLKLESTATGGVFGNLIMSDTDKTRIVPSLLAHGVSAGLPLTPQVAIPVDIIQMVPGLSQLQAGIRKAMGNLAAGPTFGVRFPIKIATGFMLVALDSVNYGLFMINQQVSGWHYYGDYYGNSRPVGLKMVFAWSYDFDVSIGLFFTLSVAQLWSCDKKVSFGLLELLARQPITNGVGYAYGQQFATPTAYDGDMNIPEIVFA